MSATTVSVREAKARFSEIISQAFRGEVITVTSHGVPKAQVAPVDMVESVAMKVDRQWLQNMSHHQRGTPAEKQIREDRDGRA